MDRQSNMGYIRSFAHNAELQETRKTVKNGGFLASDTGRRSIQGGDVFLTGDRISVVRGGVVCVFGGGGLEGISGRDCSEAWRSEAERSGANV